MGCFKKLEWEETSAKTWTLGLCNDFWTSDQSRQTTGLGRHTEIKSVCPIRATGVLLFTFPPGCEFCTQTFKAQEVFHSLLLEVSARPAKHLFVCQPTPAQSTSLRLGSLGLGLSSHWRPRASASTLNNPARASSSLEVAGDSTFLRATFHSTTFSRPPRPRAAPFSYRIVSPKVALSIHHLSLSNNHLIAASVHPEV